MHEFDLAPRSPERTVKAMHPKAFLLIASGLALLCSPLAAQAREARDHDDPPGAAAYVPFADQRTDWADAAHRRDRIDAVGGYAEFADDEAELRSALDAGLARGWLDRDDFLIFARQLHQTELHEAREMRLHGPRLSQEERAFIRGTLEEAYRQLKDIHAER